MTMQEQIRALVHRNHAKLLEHSAIVGGLLTQIEAGGAVLEALTKAQNLTHQMKGAAGSIGFAEMGSAAAALDENLKALRKQSGAISPSQLQSALDLFAALQRIAGQTAPEMSALYNADLSHLER
jgi:HPt (histidine-containing phosphotransfer) domain-containing protein